MTSSNNETLASKIASRNQAPTMEAPQQPTVEIVEPAQVPAAKKSAPPAPGGTAAERLEALWMRRRGQFEALLQDPGEARKLFIVAKNVICRSDDLMACTKSSLAMALIQCAETGLYPGPYKEAALIARKNKGVLECCFQPMYPGVVKLVMNTGLVSSVQSDVIYEEDVFNYSKGTDPHLFHHRTFDNRGKRLGAFCVLNMRDGSSFIEVMSEGEIMEIAAKSPAFKFKSGPWFDSSESVQNEMRKKTLILRAAKPLPKSSRLVAAMFANDSAEVPDEVEAQPTTELGVDILQDLSDD